MKKLSLTKKQCARCASITSDFIMGRKGTETKTKALVRLAVVVGNMRAAATVFAAVCR
jgi:hypothetical protein